MIEFIDEHKLRWGVEPICSVLPIAPGTYFAAKKRPLDGAAGNLDVLAVELGPDLVGTVDLEVVVIRKTVRLLTVDVDPFQQRDLAPELSTALG